MVAYSFQARFADAVATGRKHQTIRAQGKRRHARPGDRVQLYTGMRTKSCRKLVDPDPVCTSAEPVFLESVVGKIPGTVPLCPLRIWVNGRHPAPEESEAIARADGFASIQEMHDWFKQSHGLPFHGVLIKWEPQA